MKRHYSPYVINNDGEKALDRLFDDELVYSPELGDWHIFHSYKLEKHRHKKKGEIDFILLNKRGVLVIEVKGGPIELEEGCYYHSEQHGNPRKLIEEDPFQQVEGNVGALIDFFKAQQVKDILVSGVVIFPQSNFTIEPNEPLNLWHLFSPTHPDRPLTLKQFLIRRIEAAWENPPFTPKEFSGEEINNLARLLAPCVTPSIMLSHLALTKKVADKRSRHNQDVLEGLAENKRIMVQGPPGSGKSSYAFSYLKRQAEQGKSGIYLCWNDFLQADMKLRIEAASIELPGLANIKVLGYYSWVKELIGLAGMDSELLNFSTISAMEALVGQSIDVLHNKRKLPAFDFVVVDECQDIFDKGIGKFVAPYEEFLVLYDLVQGYDVYFDEKVNFIKRQSAHYKLKEFMRGTGGEGINEFIAEVLGGEVDWTRAYGKDVHIVRWQKPTDLMQLLQQVFRQFILDKNFHQKAVVLFTSNFLDKKKELGKEIDEVFAANPTMELLVPGNLHDNSGKIKYTTALKYKGLEKDIVILVAPAHQIKEIRSLNQLLVGASRAKLKLYLLIYS